jgi:uncharacterized membrane protein
LFESVIHAFRPISLKRSRSNNAGQIAGYYLVNSAYHGFLDTGGVFSSITPPGAQQTLATAINDLGQITGYYYNNSGGFGFVDAGGVFNSFSIPGATQIFPLGINDSGQIAGNYTDGTGNHGFAPPGTALTAVPEPAGLGILGVVLVGISLALRRVLWSTG